jgi:hypothetical protein
MSSIHNTAIRYNGMIEPGATDLCRRQHPWAGIYCFCVIKQVKLGNVFCQCQLGVKKCGYISNVFPITFVLVAGYLIFFN